MERKRCQLEHVMTIWGCRAIINGLETHGWGMHIRPVSVSIELILPQSLEHKHQLNKYRRGPCVQAMRTEEG